MSWSDSRVALQLLLASSNLISYSNAQSTVYVDFGSNLGGSVGETSIDPDKFRIGKPVRESDKPFLRIHSSTDSAYYADRK